MQGITSMVAPCKHWKNKSNLPKSENKKKIYSDTK